MNWAPFIAPDGRHFFYDRVFEGNNWEIVMNDLAGGEPVQITYNQGFDGFASMSWDGKKMLFGRSLGSRFMSNIYTFVMDISSLNVGPENFTGSIPPRAAALRAGSKTRACWSTAIASAGSASSGIAGAVASGRSVIPTGGRQAQARRPPDYLRSGLFFVIGGKNRLAGLRPG